MKSFTMKALAVAVLGLAGMGVASAATCPDPAANGNQGYAAPNGAWSGETVSGATIASTTGLNGTACAMSVALNASPSSIAKAFVTDNSPNNEPRYRARFYVDLSAIASSLQAGDTIRLLNANATTGPAGISTAEVTILLVGGSSGAAFRFQVADPGQASSFKTVTVPAKNPTGVNRVEFDYNTTATQSACTTGSTHGSFCAWVSSGSTAAVEGTPDSAYNLLANAFGSSGNTWSGVKFTNFGIFAGNASFRSHAASKAVVLDEFDSRRQTFINN